MIETKSWYRSTTIWGALVALGVSLAQLVGIAVDARAAADLGNAIGDLAVAAGAVAAIVGRIVAAARIGTEGANARNAGG
jgi:hypothetical protein